MRRFLIGLCPAVLAACAHSGAQRAPSPGEGPDTREPQPRPVEVDEADTRDWIALADEALSDTESARAVALYARYLARNPEGPRAAHAFRGMARAHEQLRDYLAAVRSYEAHVVRFPALDRFEVHSRKGACEAELQRWEHSAASYRAARDGTALVPSQTIEALTREGYALFQLGALEEADAVLAAAGDVVDANDRDQTERLADYYFVGMARFYRAAVIHRRFREIEIELPESKMAKDFARKLELLELAQDRYNETIAAKHVYWVSAAGFQLGSLFEEFYDALMHAPVPAWLDERQRRVYYEELKSQLRPVVDKAVWVFEKNLEAARRLGYENPFIDRTEEQLGQLQAVLLSGDSGLGEPHPWLAPVEARGELEPQVAAGESELRPADRKLFVPLPTPL